MIRISLLTLSCMVLMACSTTPRNHPAVLSPFGDGSQWIVWQDMDFSVEQEGDVIANIRVPRGFVTDLASTPRRFWAVYPPFGKYLSAAILHDYLYWTQICDRDISDNIFYQTMKSSGVDAATQAIFFMVLKSQGELAWQENNTEKQQGLVRVIPDAFLNPEDEYVTRTTDWSQLRETLRSLNVKDESTPDQDDMLKACVALSGNDPEPSTAPKPSMTFLGLSL